VAAALPLLAGYWAFGQYWGTWVILVVEFQARHAVSDSRLGLLYAALSVVAVLVMLLAAPRLQRLPLATSVPLSLVILAIGAVVIALQPTSAVVIGFVLVGAGNGLIDVYLNVAAQRLEASSRRPVLQWLHASYAFGGITGAAVAGLIRTADVDFRYGIVYTGVALFATALWNVRKAPSTTSSSSGDHSPFSIAALFRTPALWIPAFVVLSAFLIEGSMDTWSGKYLREQLHSTAGAAAIAFVAFSTALFFGRLFAGRVLYGLGNRTTIVLAGSGAVLAGLVATLSSEPVVVGVAFLLLGFSLSAATPAGFGLVERYEEDPASAIAAVTTIGYTGFVWSPPILGWVSETFSLKATMAVIVVATLGIVAGGIAAPRNHVGR